jgi:16S rRNA (guanine966-N2)-methyltransferase
MRVIAGTAKGRRLKTPSGLGTRPMTARAREALFSSLGQRVQGAAVLDLYAGSGSLGIEALSRGAASVTFVERSRQALEALRANLGATGFEATVVAGDAAAAISRLSGDFDLVFVDPPFAMSSTEAGRVVAELVTVTSPGATVVVHRRAGEAAMPVPVGMEALGDRRYGDSVLWLFSPQTS